MGQALARVVLPPILPSHIRGQEQEEDQDLDLITYQEDEEQELVEQEQKLVEQEQFPSLTHLPPELALSVLRHLGATDLCLASCVWQQLATDNILWQGLCR